ncbi:tyrosine-type recombinase/integrase [uncultured Deinococcus sp.]|uniref:tyrosine-type recombinase/integrase n=1 Tax=uncultured Deinococcus sp. TaxID=158789 RepID=UPI0025DD409C|nr:tyrosine-type recombinase/integrase [uncultured Deinococcus sp.]
MNHIEAFRHYLEIEERRTPQTVRAYLADVRQLRAYLDAEHQSQRGRDWEQLTAADLRGFLASARPKPHRVHRLIASWVKFWTFLRDVQHVPGIGNPPGELKRPKLPGRLPKYLETQDIAKLLNAAHQDKDPGRAARNWAVLAFLYGTGARISEVIGLTFDRIQYVDGLPTSVRVIGKGDKERVVPLSGTAQRALVQWLKIRRTEGHPTSPHVWSYLSGKQRGQPFSIRTIQAMTTATAKRAGLDPAKVSPHKMRHSYATALVEQGRSLHEIGTILGHENPATTAIYGRVKARQLEQAAASLPDVL